PPVCRSSSRSGRGWFTCGTCTRASSAPASGPSRGWASSCAAGWRAAPSRCASARRVAAMKVLKQTPEYLSLRLDPPDKLGSVTWAAVFFAVPALAFGIWLHDWRAIGFAIGIVPLLGTCWGIAYIFMWPRYKYDFDKTLGQLRVVPQRLSTRQEATTVYPLA